MRPFSGGEYVKPIGGCVNRAFGTMEPWKVAAITATSVLGGVWIWSEVSKDESKSQFPLGAMRKFSQSILSLTVENVKLIYEIILSWNCFDSLVIYKVNVRK